MEIATAVDSDKKYFKCRITLVNPGSSDSVIDVWPAEAKTEKIWLDNTPGIERWQIVDRLLNNFAEKGTRVPKPAKWHNDGKFNKPDLDEQDIPLVRLDGAVLQAPPAPQVVPITPQINQRDVDARFQAQNQKIDALATAISNLTNALKPAPIAETITKCDECPTVAKNAAGLKRHKTTTHKKGG